MFSVRTKIVIAAVFLVFASVLVADQIIYINSKNLLTQKQYAVLAEEAHMLGELLLKDFEALRKNVKNLHSSAELKAVTDTASEKSLYIALLFTLFIGIGTYYIAKRVY